MRQITIQTITDSTSIDTELLNFSASFLMPFLIWENASKRDCRFQDEQWSPLVNIYKKEAAKSQSLSKLHICALKILDYFLDSTFLFFGFHLLCFSQHFILIPFQVCSFYSNHHKAVFSCLIFFQQV